MKSAMGVSMDLFPHHLSASCVSYITQATNRLNNASDPTVCGRCVTKTKRDQEKRTGVQTRCVSVQRVNKFAAGRLFEVSVFVTPKNPKNSPPSSNQEAPPSTFLGGYVCVWRVKKIGSADVEWLRSLGVHEPAYHTLHLIQNN